MNFDEMDIEPKSEPPVGRNSSSIHSSDIPSEKTRGSSPIPSDILSKTSRKSPSTTMHIFSKEDQVNDVELQNQLLQRTVPLDDGSIGYVFTCTNGGSLSTWRCHVCNFMDTWKNMKKHLDIKWHLDGMSKYHHSRSNFSKVDNIMSDFSKGQPLPPGMEDEIAGPCQILKSLETYEHPLIGLEFLLELHIVDLREPRYLCLLCDKRGDPRSILVHLTSQNHYLMYLRKYFRKFYSLIDKLPKSNECRGNVSNVTSHLIAKLEEKYGRLQPTATREDVVNIPEQRSIILQKIDNSVHFSESADDAYLEDMLTIEYVQNPQLLLKNFPLKPKHVIIEKPKEDTTSLFNKSSKKPPQKNIRSNRENVRNAREESPDVVYVGSSKTLLPRNGRSRDRTPLRSRERSPYRGRDVSSRRSRDRSMRRSRDRSMRRSRDRSMRRSRDASLRRSRDRSSLHGDRSPLRGLERSPLRMRERSPFRGSGKERSPPVRLRTPRSRSRHRSPSFDRSRRRFVSPSYYRSLRYRLSRSRSRSPRLMRSRSPIIDRDRFHRRSPSPLGRIRSRERSPPPRYGGHRYRTPEREIRRVIVHRSPSPPLRSSEYASRYRARSRSRERSAYRGRKSRSRSKPRPDPDVDSGSKSSVFVDGHSNVKERARIELNPNRAYIREAKEVEDQLNKDMERYNETPESHPAYQDEWKKFWCAKFKEIQSQGKEDPHKYDYKPEWITFWNVRVKELFDEELKSKIKALKGKYGISGEEKEDKSDKPKKTASNSPIEEEKKPVIDIKTMWKELTGCDIKDEPTSAERRSLSPWEEDTDDVASDKAASTKEMKKESNNVLDDGSTQPISPESLSSISETESPRRYPYRRSRSRSLSRSRSRSASRTFSKEYPFKDDYRKPPTKKIHFENPLNIITVLRQLSVLEFQLGSYASHVISLLTSGLTMERIKPQSSIDLLTKDNILFLELVKEKLKGQLLAGVVPKSMVKATLFCIKNIEELLQLVPKLKPTVPPPIPAPPPGLLYGAGLDPTAVAPVVPATPIAYGSHVYGHHYAGYKKPPFKQHFDRGGGDKYKERYPFRKTSPKRMDETAKGGAERSRRISDEYPFRNNEPTVEPPAKEKPATSGEEEIPIDKNLIALQIAEVLTQQGRSDVSNEELQALINTVVENLKQEQKMKALQKDVTSSKNAAIPAVMDALATAAAVPVANLNNTVAAAAAALNVSTIPASFNLNDVSSSTLALLQDAYVNASVLSANAPCIIEELTEADLIQMLRNFKSIPRAKQEKLIEYLRKLEVTNPERVEELKKYVNVL